MLIKQQKIKKKMNVYMVYKPTVSEKQVYLICISIVFVVLFFYITTNIYILVIMPFEGEIFVL